MIDRNEKDKIGFIINDDVVVSFYFCHETPEEERKIARAIFRLKGTAQFVADKLIQQLHDELKVTCRTELVKEIVVDVSDIYHTDKRAKLDKDNDINMDFYTDYIVKREISKPLDIYYGFYCGKTLGRFSRKDKKFYEVSNSMLDKCHIM